MIFYDTDSPAEREDQIQMERMRQQPKHRDPIAEELAIRIELAKLLRDREPGVQCSLETADAIMARFTLGRK